MSSLECIKCGRIVDNIGETAVKVTCSYCVLMTVGFPDTTVKTYKPTGRPPGWHFMSEFVDKDGNVFHKGKEMKKLKGTLKPTKVSPPKKKIKRRTKDEIYLARHELKKAALKKAAKKQQDFIKHNIDKG